ncbi:ankyrin repeat domain-containing protein [Luteimonas sp. MC1750]|uniref:ankyrin repeat domain-containing protein n=1 Tax=Luteimonas sp. MC1750 TaxID=2799326 RepID=UPI0018F0801C|nr:ankyrin repeat domain-containing protein [Luteimonas sp. MC1750]MBJ6983996.1 ankyrin repeat domain-containing protein [Luteimonas sp. MC1750]QQO06808.1 ankyrin repeat domain-containing protein [Luteimonas sp. MC1750]
MSKASVWNTRTWYSDTAYGDDDGERSARELKSPKYLREALAAGADPNEHDALLTAAEKGTATQLKALIKAGADLERTNDEGLTALHISVDRQDQDKFDALIKAGANVDAKVPATVQVHEFSDPEISETDEPGHTPAMRAARVGNLGMLSTLKGKGAAMEGVLHAAVVGDIESLERREYGHLLRENDQDRGYLALGLIEAGIDPNERTDIPFRIQPNPLNRGKKFEADQSTPLHLAAFAGKGELIEALLASGADVEAVDGQGRTALLVSEEYEAFEVLIGAKANLKARDVDGNSVLHHHWREETAALLIEAGADVLAKNGWGELPGDGFEHPSRGLIRTAQKKAQLENIAKQNRIDEDLATPEQALAARQARYGRAM